MNSSPRRETLELEVSDFGPIIEGTVDLRPLTVFIGPSNTGKSYLAILIYALHRFFCGTPGLLPKPFRGSHLIGRGLKAMKLPDETVAALVETARMFLESPESLDQQGVSLPSSVADLIRSDFDRRREALSREIGRCFGINDPSALIRRGQRRNARVVLRRGEPNDRGRFEHQLALSRAATDFETTIPEVAPRRIGTEDADEMRALLSRVNMGDWEEQVDEIWWLMRVLTDVAVACLVDPFHLPAYYLPAGRTGVMHAHSVMVRALIGSAPMAGIRSTVLTPVFSGVLADFLEQLIEVDRPRYSRRRRERDLGARIEEAVLSGSVRVDRSPVTSYPGFTYRPDAWKDDLPLMNASSMVSELAPVVLYLRYLVQPGDMLIVEEPESHLHPAMQVEFTRQLAVLVDAGVRVIVTTHSEWLLEELANIVRRSQLPKASRKDGDVALRPDQVGAWLFQPKRRPKGSVVSEIGLDESGLYPAGFDDVTAALHNDWADITSRIEASP